MRTIRQNVFETNSSSMHAITVPAFLNTTKQEIEEMLEPYKTKDGYYIEVELDEDRMKGDPFNCRHNELHDNFMDKFLYAYGTMLEYWNRKLFNYDDYDEYRGMSAEEATFNKNKDFAEFKAKANEYYIKQFENKLGFYSCTVPVFEQYVLAELIRSGDFERHINRVRRERRKSK